MPNPMPAHYFRIRDNGATVYRVGQNAQAQRIEMDQIAVINTNRGDFKATGGAELGPDDKAAITAWLEARMAVLAARGDDRLISLIEELNLAAHWAQTQASASQLEAATDDVLMAMHDLRAALIRKKADQLG